MKSLVKISKRLLRRIVPENRCGDRLIAFTNFIRVHRRLPTDSMLFNDVLYRLKTSSEIIDPLRVFISDKEFVKLYVKAIVGDQYNVPIFKTLNSSEEVATFSFPDTCCIKPTHMSGEIILRSQNAPLDLHRIIRWFKSSIYPATREANYQHLNAKVLVEPLVFGCEHLPDFKIFCYLGKPRMIVVDIDRHTLHTAKYFDTSWNELPFSITYPRSAREIAKPQNLTEMLAVASTLSRPFSFIRIDMYSNGEQCFVGEMTNCPWNATGVFIPASAETLASKIIFESD